MTGSAGEGEMDQRPSGALSVWRGGMAFESR